jgi:hypothetical protein
MRDIILKKITAFDRTVRLRNTMETIAALAVAAFFVYAAWMQRNGLERLGSAIIVAGALWIIYYIRRYGADPADPIPDQTMADYQQARPQIRASDPLAAKRKFWYLLPMYVGLLTSTVGMLKERAEKGSLTWTDAIAPLIYTLIFAGIWWLNEVYTMRKLQRWRTQLMSGMERESSC